MEFVQFQDFLNQNISHTLSLLGAIQGVILATIVWNFPEQHRTSNRLLSLFIISFVHILIVLRIFQEFDFPYSRLIIGIRSLAPITLYLYIQSLHKEINWKKQYWHLLIVLVDFALIYGFGELHYSSLGKVIDWTHVSFGWFILLFTVYFHLCYKALQRYKEKVVQNFSDTNQIKLRWVHQVFFFYFILILLGIIQGFVSIGFPDAFRPYAGIFTAVAYTSFMYFITIKGKLTPEIYRLRKLDNRPIQTSGEASKKNSIKENQELKLISRQVIKLIEEKKLYKEMGLSLNEVAEKIDVQPYLVSQAINACLEKNFFELINRYRVEEAKILLMDESWNYLSIVGIGFEAGFNSKTAFNTAFKKYAGMTPSEFKKKKLGVVGQD